jgi:hypothetical protein
MDFEPLTFGAQRDAADFDAMTLPAVALPAMAAAGLLGSEACTLVALWRALERMMTAKPLDGAMTVVDVSSEKPVSSLRGETQRDLHSLFRTGSSACRAARLAR